MVNSVWTYPFASNHRMMFYLHDMDERHRIQSQCSVYLNKNTIDSNCTLAHLQAISRSHDPESFAMTKRMQRFAGNILGSPSYMLLKKKELCSLLSSKGAPTLWWTLSLANYYWTDLHVIFGDPPTRNDNELDDSYSRRIQSYYREMFINNPNLVDESFFNRVKEYIKIILGREGWDAVWFWYRFEFQKRGSIHVHGLCKLRDDPGLEQLAKVVYLGRKSAQILRISKAISIQSDSDLYRLYPNDDFLAYGVDNDVFISYLSDIIHANLSANQLTNDHIDSFI